MKKRKISWPILAIFSMFFIIIIIIRLYNSYKAIPSGLSYESDVYYTDDVEFLYDVTYKKQDEIAVEQEIFTEVFQMIADARKFIVIDMFLFNDYTDQTRDFPDLSGDLTKALLHQKAAYPNLQVVFITDPINTGYHSYEEEYITLLKENDIEVVITDLNKLRDSNKWYTAAWRLFFQPFGQMGKGWLPNYLAKDAPKLTLRSYLELFNIKANHRKAVITENHALVTSANPHNESGFASNIAFKVSGEIINDFVEAEQAVIDYSGGKTKINVTTSKVKNGNIAVQYITEGKILKHVVEEINQTKEADEILIGMFYIADRDVINALHRATERGVAIKLVLDPNKVAFGNQKTGLPNLPIASELIKDEKIAIRWYETDEDQYHTKLMYLKKSDEHVAIGGSANYTTRNLDDLNLENNIKITAEADTAIMQDIDAYFNRIWNNENGKFTSDYKANKKVLTPILKVTYWIQKVTDLTTY